MCLACWSIPGYYVGVFGEAVLPEHIQEILTRWQSRTHDCTVADAVADIETLCGEVESLETAWRAAEEQTFADTQIIVRLTSLLRKLRCTKPPTLTASKEERRAYEDLLESVDAALRTH